MQRVADGAGAVVAGVPPTGVTAAEDVGLGADPVGGADDRLDPGRSGFGRHQHPVVQQPCFLGRGADVYFC